MEELKWYTVRREFVEGWPMMGLYALIVLELLVLRTGWFW